MPVGSPDHLVMNQAQVSLMLRFHCVHFALIRSASAVIHECSSRNMNSLRMDWQRIMPIRQVVQAQCNSIGLLGLFRARATTIMCDDSQEEQPSQIMLFIQSCT